MSLKVTKENFENEILKSSKTVLLDFWASWCGPCQMLAPIIDDIANENPQYLIGKVNVDEEAELAGAFGIISIPTLIVIKNGKAVNKMVGLRTKEDILTMLK